MSNVIHIRTALAHTPRPDVEREVDRATFLIGRGPMQAGPNYDAVPPRSPWPLVILNIALWSPVVMAISGMLS